MKYLIILSVCFLSLVAFSVEASRLYFSLSADEYTVGDIFKIDIALDTEGKSANTAEISLQFDKNHLELKDIGKGNSVFVLWPQEPVAFEAELLSFIGGTPGGFTGRVNLISLYFEAKKSGSARIIFRDGSEILLNDGKGTQITPVFQNINITILPGNGTKNELENDLSSDSVPPQNFQARVLQNDTVFGGKYFLVFSASDAQTGISHYEIREGKSDWQVAESPYLLNDQDLNGNILVKAVDRSGNETVISATLPEKKNNFILILILSIFALCVIAVIVIFRKFKKSEKL